jgi:hypothetical protein
VDNAELMNEMSDRKHLDPEIETPHERLRFEGNTQIGEEEIVGTRKFMA